MNKIDELKIDNEESKRRFDESLSNLLDELKISDKELITELFITVFGRWMIFHKNNHEYVRSVLEKAFKEANIEKVNENTNN